MKKESCAALKKKLDSVFSLYIRHRDAGICYTCGVQKMPSEMQCGHYVSRVKTNLRWSEDNCHCQCYACNCMKHGDLITYRENLVKEYGLAFVENMEAMRFDTIKLTSEWYHGMIDHYKALLKEYQ